MHKRTTNLLATAVLLLAVVAGMTGGPGLAQAETPSDFSLKNGHFFTQAAQDRDGNAPMGYSVTDDGGVLFWTAFQDLGGVEDLGYPISRRFMWAGRVTQVTQNAVMQWDSIGNRVELVNIFDYLSMLGKDDWLEQTRQVPKPAAINNSAASWAEVEAVHHTLLSDAPLTSTLYFGCAARRALFGLPTSKVQDYDSCLAVRFQRAVLYFWKHDDGSMKGEFTVAPAGEIAYEAGLFEAYNFMPESRMPEAGLPARGSVVASSRASTRSMQGVATWYGAYFQGSLMRNGEPYNMYDPTTTAANVFPLGSLLRVTDTNTGRSVLVRVRDTGAFTYPILVDLSWAAFAQIADPYQGVVNVTVELVE